jgi:HSP20 family protein
MEEQGRDGRYPTSSPDQPSTIVGVTIMVLVSYARPSFRPAPALSLRGFDDAIARLFGDSPSPSVSPRAHVRTPALDVSESDTHYTVQIEMPGIDKASVDVAIEGRNVSVKAATPPATERNTERTTERNTEPKADAEATAHTDGAVADRVVYRERASTAIARSFTLPVELDESQSSAKLDNGVLTLILAKKREAQRTKITVN